MDREVIELSPRHFHRICQGCGLLTRQSTMWMHSHAWPFSLREKGRMRESKKKQALRLLLTPSPRYADE